MKRGLHILFFLTIISTATFAQLTPDVTSWILNQTGAVGYNNIPSNVQEVQYSTINVYISCTCIPSYDIGPWKANPNTPINQNFVFKITRSPVKNTGTLVKTGLGHIGTWSNGVSIFNAKDAHSYNNGGVWDQNAIVVEGISFDTCLGHPAGNGEYHTHLNPRCLYDDADSLHHSPIIGYAFDGFPIYGAYGYTNPNTVGNIKRMRTSYRLRNIANRTTLADGTVLTSGQYGPAISGTYPLGYYIEDYEYVDSLGDLDEHNGRYCVTPDYPSGVYAYFVTIDSAHNGVYPYTLGSTYYGTVQTGNTGPASGKNTIGEPVVTYSPATGLQITPGDIHSSIYPNPTADIAYLFVDALQENNITATLYDVNGAVVTETTNIQPAVAYPFNVSQLPAGIYYLRLKTQNSTGIEKIVVER